jgi:hypothetical protein
VQATGRLRMEFTRIVSQALRMADVGGFQCWINFP